MKIFWVIFASIVSIVMGYAWHLGAESTVIAYIVFYLIFIANKEK